MKGSVTMVLRGYVTRSPKPSLEKPTLIEFPLIVNKGYQDPVTGVTKGAVTYLCFTPLQKEQQVNKMKFVKKGAFLSLQGSPSRPFIAHTKEGNSVVSIRVFIKDFDILKLDKLYMRVKFFNGKTGEFTTFTNRKQTSINTNKPFRIDNDYFYREVTFDFVNYLYDVIGSGRSLLTLDWYEYINPPKNNG